MPESVRDRCTKAHEYIFLLSKSPRYYYDWEAIKEPASPDTHARYARGRSDAHKWADGGPGGQTIARTFEHMLRPKPIAGWARGPGSHSAVEHAKPKEGRKRKLAEAGSGTKNNESFDAAMAVMPEYRNKRSVWTVPTKGFKEAHFATFPPDLIKPCILAGSRPGDVVLDPFMGSGTTAAVAVELGRRWVGCELNPDYVDMIARRVSPQTALGF